MIMDRRSEKRNRNENGTKNEKKAKRPPLKKNTTIE